MTQIVWLLSLIQFNLSLGFALFFLVLDLGLVWVLLIYRIQAWKNSHAMYAYRFWVRVFALCSAFAFAASVPVFLNLGVVWPQLLNRAGEVLGPLLGLIIIITFIFKSSFLGSMLYGQRILSDLSHTLVLALVALGISLVTYIVAAILAWQQMPAGISLQDGIFSISDWGRIFTGLTPFIFVMLVLTGLLLAMAMMLLVLARQSKIRPSAQGEYSTFKFTAHFFVAVLVLQILCAWLIGQQVLAAQPSRLAAVLPQWDDFTSNIQLTFWSGLDIDLAEQNWSVVWPPNLSDIFNNLLQFNLVGKPGLNDSIGLQPPLYFTYASARIAVILNLFLLVLSVYLWRLAAKTAFNPDKLNSSNRVWIYITAALLVLLQLVGWAHMILGSLPYAVYDSLTLRELSSNYSFTAVTAILAISVIVYILLLWGLFRLINHNIRFGVIPVKRVRSNP